MFSLDFKSGTVRLRKYASRFRFVLVYEDRDFFFRRRLDICSNFNVMKRILQKLRGKDRNFSRNFIMILMDRRRSWLLEEIRGRERNLRNVNFKKFHWIICL